MAIPWLDLVATNSSSFLPNAGNTEEVNEIAERLLVSLAEPYDIDGKALTLTASIGIAQGNEDIQEPNVLVQQADMAMYKAKRRGKPQL